jgi:hypothetical protein
MGQGSFGKKLEMLDNVRSMLGGSFAHIFFIIFLSEVTMSVEGTLEDKHLNFSISKVTYQLSKHKYNTLAML